MNGPSALFATVLLGLQLGFCTVSGAESETVYRDDFKQGWIFSCQYNGNAVSTVAGQFFNNGMLTYDFRTPGQDAVLISKRVNVPVSEKSALKITFVPDGSRQKLFLVLKDRDGESFLMEAGRLFSKDEKTISLSMENLFVRPDSLNGDRWGGTGNLVFNSPLTEIAIVIDNFPDRVNRKGAIRLSGLMITSYEEKQTECIFWTPLPAVPVEPQGQNSCPNIVRNPSFEDVGQNGAPSNWEAARGTLSRIEGGTNGKFCAQWVMNKGVSENLGAYMSQKVQVPEGAKTGDVWLFSARIRTMKQVRIGLILECGGTYSEPINSFLFPEDGWQSFLIPFQIINSAEFFKPHIYVYKAETPIYIDDVQIWKAPSGTGATSRGIRKFITPMTIIPEAFEE